MWSSQVSEWPSHAGFEFHGSILLVTKRLTLMSTALTNEGQCIFAERDVSRSRGRFDARAERKIVIFLIG